ncbi:MAG: hypothetical protein M3P08_15740 [Thermoproteota archaeon]|nr:hypothetical protein [Thermoproteota archaeon]
MVLSLFIKREMNCDHCNNSISKDTAVTCTILRPDGSVFFTGYFCFNCARKTADYATRISYDDEPLRRKKAEEEGKGGENTYYARNR